MRKDLGAGVQLIEVPIQTPDAGASFTVAPDLNESVAQECDWLGLAHLPGVATSTEIGKALKLGLI